MHSALSDRPPNQRQVLRVKTRPPRMLVPPASAPPIWIAGGRKACAFPIDRRVSPVALHSSLRRLQSSTSKCWLPAVLVGRRGGTLRG